MLEGTATNRSGIDSESLPKWDKFPWIDVGAWESEKIVLRF